MSKWVTKENLFKPTKRNAETKADITDRVARSILQAEEKKRHEKTARLRARRIANEKV